MAHWVKKVSLTILLILFGVTCMYIAFLCFAFGSINGNIRTDNMQCLQYAWWLFSNTIACIGSIVFGAMSFLIPIQNIINLWKD